MKTRINEVVSDWKRIKNHCRTTVNKNFTENEPSEQFKEALLISEHSPIRLLEVDWSWEDIKYWLSTEWSRHKFEKFISTQREDRTQVDRNKKPQDSPVKFDGYANAQNLIDAFRKRLCFQAHPEATELALDFKRTIAQYEPELSMVLVPNCIYRCGCPEFSQCSCHFWDNFVKNNKDIDITDIRQRYKRYFEMTVKKKED